MNKPKIELREIWITKSYQSIDGRDFVFFMGYSAVSLEWALRESLGETKIEDLKIEKAPTVWKTVNDFMKILVEERTGCPELPKHKNWSIWDNRFPIHLPKLKEIPDKLF